MQKKGGGAPALGPMLKGLGLHRGTNGRGGGVQTPWTSPDPRLHTVFESDTLIWNAVGTFIQNYRYLQIFEDISNSFTDISNSITDICKRIADIRN